MSDLFRSFRSRSQNIRSNFIPRSFENLGSNSVPDPKKWDLDPDPDQQFTVDQTSQAILILANTHFDNALSYLWNLIIHFQIWC